MKWTFTFLAWLSLLVLWEFLGTIMASGKKDSQRGLLGSHKLFHKKFYGKINGFKYDSHEQHRNSSTSNTYGIKAGSRFANKKSFVAAPPDSGESATDGGWNLENIPDHVTASNGKDASAAHDTGDVEFIDGDEVIEITDGPEEDRGKTPATAGDSVGRHSREKQGRRQKIESDADFSYQEANQDAHEQNNDEEHTEKENISSNDIAGSEYSIIEPGATKPVEYATGLSRDNTLTDEAQSDYQSAQLSMAEGTNKDSELFNDELDGVLGALVKSDSALGRKTGNHYKQLDEKRTSYRQQASNDESDSEMSSDTTSPHSSDDSPATSVKKIVTETEGGATDEAEKPHPEETSGSEWEGAVSSTNSKTSGIFHASAKKMPSSESRQTTPETSRKIDEEAENLDDVSETDIEEIDDDNKKMIDSDISLLDQPSKPIKSIQSNGAGSNQRLQNTAEVLHEADKQEETLEQGLNGDRMAHKNSIQTGGSVAENTAANVKNTEDKPENPLQSEVDLKNQFTGVPTVTNQQLNEATSENQQLEGIIPPPHQETRGTAKAGNMGSSLAKLLLEANQKFAKMRESGNEQEVAERVSQLNTATTDRQLKSRFTNQQLDTKSRSAPPNVTPISNNSLGMLMHQILLNYFRNESALHGIIKSKVNATVHPLANLNILNSSGVVKHFNQEAKTLGSNKSDIVSKKPQELQIQDDTGIEKLGNLTTQGIAAEAENKNQAQLSATISNNENNVNNNIESNDHESTPNNLQKAAAYMDPAPNPEDSKPSQAIKKQELNGSGEEVTLVLKNKTFGILIGRHKNATVRLFSAPNSDGEQVTAKSVPNSDGEQVIAKSAPNSGVEQVTAKGAPNSGVEQVTAKSAPNSGGKQVTAKSALNNGREQVTATENDVSVATMDIHTNTSTLLEAKPPTATFNQSKGSLDKLGISKQHVGLVDVNSPKDKSRGSTKSQVDEKNHNPPSYIKDLKSLEIVLSRDFMSDWMYDQKDFSELGITPAMLRAGVVSLGLSTRLKRVFRKALKGTEIKLLVIAGSISAGAGLEIDLKNLGGVYYKAFVNWWYRSITPITASKLEVNAVAIGGSDSEYFSYCMKNYIDQRPDIVIWELASNDYRRYEGRTFLPGKPLEQLTRLILSLPSHPALFFVNFFNKIFYKTTVGQDCPSSEDEGEQAIAKYYGIPSLSWRNVVCPEIDKNNATMSIDDLFSSDGNHPSITGHAQMASLLITYMKSVLEKAIILEMDEENRLPNNVENIPDSQVFSLPQPMYNNAVNSSPLCWTLLTPDYTSKAVHNTLPEMDFVSANEFQFTNISHWPIRLDRQRCLRALAQGATLKLKFFVPPVQTLNQAQSLNASGAREVVIFTHNSYRGSARVWLDENHGEAQVVTEMSRPRRTQTDILNTPVLPGLHTLTIQSIEQGFCLSAVAVS